MDHLDSHQNKPGAQHDDDLYLGLKYVYTLKNGMVYDHMNKVVDIQDNGITTFDKQSMETPSKEPDSSAQKNHLALISPPKEKQKRKRKKKKKTQSRKRSKCKCYRRLHAVQEQNAKLKNRLAHLEQQWKANTAFGSTAAPPIQMSRSKIISELRELRKTLKDLSEDDPDKPIFEMERERLRKMYMSLKITSHKDNESSAITALPISVNIQPQRIGYANDDIANFLGFLDDDANGEGSGWIS